MFNLARGRFFFRLATGQNPSWAETVSFKMYVRLRPLERKSLSVVDIDLFVRFVRD